VVKLPTEIDDCTLLGRCTKTSRRPFVTGMAGAFVCGTTALA